MAKNEEMLVEPRPWPTTEVIDPDDASFADDEVLPLPAIEQIDNGDEPDFDTGDEELELLPPITEDGDW